MENFIESLTTTDLILIAGFSVQSFGIYFLAGDKFSDPD